MKTATHSAGYRFLGCEILVDSADIRLLKLVEEKLETGRDVRVSGKKRSVHFTVTSHPGPGPLRRAQSFSNDRVFFLAIPGKVMATCYLHHFPWQVDLQVFGSTEPDYVFDYAFGPILHLLLKRFYTFQWHCAAIEKNGKAVLLPGHSGSGKSTTALTLLEGGFNFLSDDETFVTRRGNRIEAIGTAPTIHLTEDTLSLFPKMLGLKDAPRVRRSKGMKRRVDVSKVAPRNNSKRCFVHCVLFPRVTGAPKTKLKPLTPSQGLARCLDLFDAGGYKAWLPDKRAMQCQLELYCLLVESCPTYDLLLGKDTAQTTALIEGLL